MADGQQRANCAVYTRKSSEEGLDQPFNSLQAQREACEAYIASQRHEGWRCLHTHYDDGGFSGGNTDRPALKRLLEDISEGKVNIVVVYKVDRLTRSLADFAKIIEVFDANKVSFVSVTQQFNTTTSMGRLTLNVLLSFAQFEREVTGERIRDKIAASKKKGMWMGGFVPLGYDLRERKLIINEEEAKLVREIFKQYLRLGSVRRLRQHLDRRQLRTKLRTDTTGRSTGGKSFSRGALYQMLRNHLYIGQVHHRGESYEGQHEGIIDRETWEKVAKLLDANRHARRVRTTNNPISLLTGMLFHQSGCRYTPTHSNKNGRRYRYYTSQAVIRGQRLRSAVDRIPAEELERLVLGRLCALFTSGEELVRVAEAASVAAQKLKQVLDGGKELSEQWNKLGRLDLAGYVHRVVQRVVVCPTEVRIEASPQAIVELLLPENSEAGKATSQAEAKGREVLQFICALDLQQRSNQLRLVVKGAGPQSEQRMPLIKAIARARDWYDRIVAGEVHSFRQLAAETGLGVRYVSRIFRCGSLSPALIEAVLEGNQPSHLTVERLSRIPMQWDRQRL